MRFETFEHTADVGIKAYGKDLDEMFENAAFGMFGLIADLDGVKNTGEFKVSLEGADEGQLLVDWLTELLYIHEVYNVLLKDFKVDITKGDKELLLRAVIRGETIDDRRHHLKTMVKAVTYHMLEVNLKDGYLSVLLDI